MGNPKALEKSHLEAVISQPSLNLISSFKVSSCLRDVTVLTKYSSGERFCLQDQITRKCVYTKLCFDILSWGITLKRHLDL